MKNKLALLEAVLFTTDEPLSMEDLEKITKLKREEIEKLWFIWDKKDIQGLDKLLTEELDLSVSEPTLESFNIRLADRESEFNPIYFLPLIAPLVSSKRFKSLFCFEHLLHGLAVRRAIRKVGLIVALFI